MDATEEIDVIVVAGKGVAAAGYRRLSRLLFDVLVEVRFEVESPKIIRAFAFDLSSEDEDATVDVCCRTVAARSRH